MMIYIYWSGVSIRWPKYWDYFKGKTLKVLMNFVSGKILSVEDGLS